MAKKPKIITSPKGAQYTVLNPQPEKLAYSMEDWKRNEERFATETTDEWARAVQADIMRHPVFQQEMQRQFREIAKHPKKCREYTGHDIAELDIHLVKKPE
jgi:hypothetical protein